MIKKIFASLLAGASVLSFSSLPALARPADKFTVHRSYSPSECNILVSGENFNCDEVIFGGFRSGEVNIKFCSQQYCLIMIVDADEVPKIARGRDFYVSSVALQEGSSITNQWNASIDCGFSRSNGLGCLGTLRNGTRLVVYTE
ncbi:MAG TPA: hypothetical protein VK184_26065 [Nostocaceae cyanobacterium]|nr:hypothetical protein [Nostocaceae cyanobacterium]